MHLIIPAHISLFWMICHPNRTFPPKELERESQNRLPLSPHRQTIPSLTSDPWPTAPVLAWYKWVVPKPCACFTPMWVHGLSAVNVFAITCGFVWSRCTFYCLFLTLYDVDESRSSFFASRFFFGMSLAWVWALSSSINPLSPFTSDLWVN